MLLVRLPPVALAVDPPKLVFVGSEPWVLLLPNVLEVLESILSTVRSGREVMLEVGLLVVGVLAFIEVSVDIE
jgi:hypothetical protein